MDGGRIKYVQFIDGPKDGEIWIDDGDLGLSTEVG